jgi:hypothetical protein
VEKEQEKVTQRWQFDVVDEFEGWLKVLGQ